MTGKLAKERAKAQRARRNENRAIERESELRNRLKLVSVQRDELLSAIEPLAELCDQLCRWDRRFDDALDAVDAAIASAKGNQNG